MQQYTVKLGCLKIVFHAKYYYGDETEEGEKGGAISTHIA
jgi:hypothetical protein